MKLQSFLSESSATSLDISKFVSGLDPKYEKRIKEILSKFSKYKVESSDVSDDLFLVNVSNGLIDFDLTFSKDDQFNDKEIYVSVEIASMVNMKYVHDAEKIKHENDHYKIALTQTFSSEKILTDTLYPSAIKFVEDLLTIAEEFEQWYFDLSAEYGKVKLTKTTYNVEDRSSDNIWKWIPICGYFWAGFKGKEPKHEAKVI